VGPRAGLEEEEKRKIIRPAGNRTPSRPTRSLVTILAGKGKVVPVLN